MKNIKKVVSMFIFTLMVSVVFTGCQNDKAPVSKRENEVEADKDIQVKDQDKDLNEDEIQLSEWDGIWNNMGAYLDDEELQDAFKELAEEENSTLEEVKKAYSEKRRADFDGMIIDGDSITFLDGFKDKDGKEIGKVDYEYKESHKVKHGNFDIEWYVFEAEEDTEYKVLLMMPIHGEEALTHFHLRYGDDLEELLAMDDWYPTFVKPNSTYEQLYEEIIE